MDIAGIAVSRPALRCSSRLRSLSHSQRFPEQVLTSLHDSLTPLVSLLFRLKVYSRLFRVLSHMVHGVIHIIHRILEKLCLDLEQIVLVKQRVVLIDS